MVELENPYDMAFSTGGLFVNECIALAAIFDEAKDWGVTARMAAEANVFAFQKAESSKRTSREILKRLRGLTSQELHLLHNGERQEQLAMAWLSVCRAYRFVGEFASELLFERYLSGRVEIDHGDFDLFFDRKAEWHPELERLSASTRKKLRQMLFRFLREADITTTDYHILPSSLTPRFQRMIAEGNESELRFFPGSRP